LAFISEEVRALGQSLTDLCQQLADVIMARSKAGKDFGVVLIPEGLIEFVPEMTPLIKEINNVLAHSPEASSFADRKELIVQNLSAGCQKTFLLIPEEIQKQLLFDRDPHGNVQVSKIDTEKLLEGIVHDLLKKATEAGNYKGKFATLTHFFGYEGRCAAPSNFDADYTYSLGLMAARLVSQASTGYIVALRRMKESVQHWEPVAVPLPSLMIIEQRHGRPKPVIEKALVNLKGKAFADFQVARKSWELTDDYGFSGPIQYFGPEELTDQAPLSLGHQTP
jgi:pyrophosphate--fructose-6-phosphate 1-phosphotransferase